MLNRGHDPLTPLNIGICMCHVPAAKDLVQSMSSIMQEAKKHLLATQNKHKSYGSIHGWGTTFGTKDLRTMSHWISVFIMIYYYLINKF